MRASWVLGIVLCLAPAAFAVSREAHPGDDIETLWNALGPGDELILHGGIYDVTAGGRFAVDVAGTSDRPITVRAADGERPIIVRTGGGQNLIDFDGAT